MKRLLLGLAIAVTALAGCEQIDTGNVGIESTLGQVKDKALPPGVYSTVFKTVYEISGKENAFELNDLKPKTQDNITLEDLDISVYWKVNGSLAPAISVKYAGDFVRGQDGWLIGSAVVQRNAREAAYNAANKWHSSNVHTKRNEIAADTQAMLQVKLDNEIKGAFEITNVVVRNILTDRALEQSIRAAANVEFETRQKQQQKALAQAESDRLKIEAEGIARANAIVAQSLTPQLLRLREIEATAKFAEKGSTTVLLPHGTTPLVSVK